MRVAYILPINWELNKFNETINQKIQLYMLLWNWKAKKCKKSFYWSQKTKFTGLQYSIQNTTVFYICYFGIIFQQEFSQHTCTEIGLCVRYYIIRPSNIYKRVMHAAI